MSTSEAIRRHDQHFFFLDVSLHIWCRFAGKLQALQSVTKEQRREYKAKFVDMDIEFQRMRERLENIHLILDDMQVEPRVFNDLRLKTASGRKTA